MADNKDRKPKEKITYIDDGSTVADMRGTTRNGDKSGYKPPRRRSTFSEKMSTYFAAMRAMVLPMLVVLAVMTGMYLVLTLMAG